MKTQTIFTVETKAASSHKWNEGFLFEGEAIESKEFSLKESAIAYAKNIDLKKLAVYHDTAIQVEVTEIIQELDDDGEVIDQEFGIYPYNDIYSGEDVTGWYMLLKYCGQYRIPSGKYRVMQPQSGSTYYENLFNDDKSFQWETVCIKPTLAELKDEIEQYYPQAFERMTETDFDIMAELGIEEEINEDEE